jgi:hypothetical protein
MGSQRHASLFGIPQLIAISQAATQIPVDTVDRHVTRSPTEVWFCTNNVCSFRNNKLEKTSGSNPASPPASTTPELDDNDPSSSELEYVDNTDPAFDIHQPNLTMGAAPSDELPMSEESTYILLHELSLI